MTKFKDQKMQAVYDLFRQRDDRVPYTGGSIGTSYRRGLAGFKADASRQSICYAAWAAGRDKRRLNQGDQPC